MQGPLKPNPLALGLIAGVLCACSAPSEESPAPPSATPIEVAPPAPWTEEFQREAVLIAAEVHIEGPPGLRDHLSVAQNGEHHTYTIKTVPEGLRQETIVREASVGEVPVRCVLDKLTLVVERRVVVVERPEEVPVTISAFGDVFWRDATTGEERRLEALVLTGGPPK